MNQSDTETLLVNGQELLLKDFTINQSTGMMKLIDPEVTLQLNQRKTFHTVMETQLDSTQELWLKDSFKSQVPE
jgi:hypothetical protein